MNDEQRAGHVLTGLEENASDDHSLAQVKLYASAYQAQTTPIWERRRGCGLRDLQGIRISMGGLRLPKPILILEEDWFVIGDTKVYPDQLLQIAIDFSGRVSPSSRSMYPTMVGFKVQRDSVKASTPLTLMAGIEGTQYLLGDAVDAVLEDKEDGLGFVWIVLEPVIIPPPRTFPSKYSISREGK